MIPGVAQLAWIIARRIRNYTYLHTRGPSVPALVAIVLSRFQPNKVIWHKYAGNWGQPDAPWAFRFQRWLLRQSIHRVTVNGFWPEQNRNILSFENPCFTEAELKEAADTHRSFADRPWRVLFVGRLETRKGIHVLLEVARKLSSQPFEFVLVGPGYEESSIADQVKCLPNVICRGELSRSGLNEEYRRSHFLVLPSYTEGFPKVVSEACGFGCIPIVTDISSIGQYVKKDIGFLLPCPDPNSLFQLLMNMQHCDLGQMSFNARRLAAKFTYERFAQRIAKEVFELIPNP